LYDPKKPPTSSRLPIYAVCKSEDGSLEFTTYNKGDGVPSGSSIVRFAQMEQVLVMNAGFYPPDRRKNLYNDPDKSAFKVEVTAPGKSDWLFELEIAGKEPNDSPRPTGDQRDPALRHSTGRRFDRETTWDRIGD
jgi:hypothetical protein